MKPALQLFVLLLLAAWTLHAIPANSPSEITISVTITRESLDKARAFCAEVKRQAGGYTGYVALFDNAGRHYSMPCMAELEGK